MITKFQAVLCCVIVAGLLGGTCSFAGEPKPGIPKGAVPEKVSVNLGMVAQQMVLTGATVTVQLDPKSPLAIDIARQEATLKLETFYKWRKNGVDINEATRSALVLNNVQLTDAATYTLVVSGSMEEQTAPFHLSVYFLCETNSNGGTMSTPIGAFNVGTYTVDGGVFDRYKVFLPFYGPNCPNQYGPFINTSGGNSLFVHTCDPSNSDLDTGIQIKQNFVPMAEMGADDDSPCIGKVKLSFCVVNGLQSRTYRTGIFFNSFTAGGITNVIFSWLYF